MLNEEEKKEFWQLLKRIGQNLRKVRISREKSQEEMSEIIGISYRHYQKLEHGDRPLSMRSLFRISRRSQIPINELVKK